MEQVLAASGSAFVSADAASSRWTIGNAAIAKTLAWQAGAGLTLVELANRATGHTWQSDLAGNPLAGEFSLCWNDITLSARQATLLPRVHAEAGAGSVTLQLDLRLAGDLDVTLCYRLPAATGVIEQWLEVTPQQPGTLTRVAPLTLSVSSLPSPVLHWVRGLQNHGHYTPAAGPYPAYRLRHEPLGTLALESGLRSTWHELAWFALDSNDYGAGAGDGAPGGAGLFAGLLYSGRWSAHAEAHDPSQTATLAVYSEGYAVPLAAGARWTSPGGFLGVYHGDLDDAAHVQHTYMRTAVMPPTAADFPWVQYNTWFAHLIDIDAGILRAEADLAARLGAEVFVIDAGWWEPSRRTSDNFTTGLGRWQPSAEKFPHGIRAFADDVRTLGMRFGIWVEPERVDLRAPGTWQDKWLVRHHDAIVSPPWPPDTISGWLCFGHPAVQAWAIDWISSLVDTVGADWLKWDSNWWGVCTCTDHGHSAGDGEFHQVQGVHVVLAELRRRFPHLMIENCAGGGARTDFAMLANSHATWLHDSSTPSRRVRFHLAGANYLFPPELCNTFIVDSADESLADPQTPRADLDTIARSRMLGAFGVSARLPDWTDQAFTAVQTAISHYKELRPLLKRGRFYHLLPQADLLCPDLLLHDEWEAYAIVDQLAPGMAQSTLEGSLLGAIWAFRAPAGAATRTLRLRGLDPAATYELADVDTRQAHSATGAHWTTEGLTVDLTNRTSALIQIRTPHHPPL